MSRLRLTASSLRDVPRGFRNMARRVAQLETAVGRLEAQLGRQDEAVGSLPGIEARLGEVAAAVTRSASNEALLVELQQTLTRFEAEAADWRRREHDILRTLHDGERANRERLAVLRTSPEYAAAYEDPDPLVSVIIPTHSRWELLRDRALPSVLGQTHRNLEVLVVGDSGVAPETEGMIAELGDERVRYWALGDHRLYPETKGDRWLVVGTPPYNAALWAARGRWIVPFADDDALRPGAVATMLEVVRARKLELAYGQLRTVCPDGSVLHPNHFPPELYHAGLVGALYLRELRFFDLSMDSHLFGEPNDWSQTRRMSQAGVRIGFHDEVIAEYFPSWAGQE